MTVKRLEKNPIVTPDDITPYHPDHEVIGVFNAGVAEYNGETLLLLRVAERPINHDDQTVLTTMVDVSEGEGQSKVIEINRGDRRYDFSDPRTILYNDSQRRVAYLTSLSYLRLARSHDGKEFTVDNEPFLYPNDPSESWGVEDPRVTKIDDTYFIQYSAISEKGVAVGLVSTKDFTACERRGLIFPPENKDVAIFPEKINGKYYALHRPVPKGIGQPEIWIAESDNLLYWGNHKHLLGLSEDGWDNGRIGGGAVPIKTHQGWLEIYHAADRNDQYCLGAVLLDLEDPSKVIAKADKPILVPEEDYETDGFFGRVVFTCGVTLQNDLVRIYYGVSDTSMAICEIKLEDILSQLHDR